MLMRRHRTKTKLSTTALSTENYAGFIGELGPANEYRENSQEVLFSYKEANVTPQKSAYFPFLTHPSIASLPELTLSSTIVTACWV